MATSTNDNSKTAGARGHPNKAESNGQSRKVWNPRAFSTHQNRYIDVVGYQLRYVLAQACLNPRRTSVTPAFGYQKQKCSGSRHRTEIRNTRDNLAKMVLSARRLGRGKGGRRHPCLVGLPVKSRYSRGSSRKLVHNWPNRPVTLQILNRK